MRACIALRGETVATLAWAGDLRRAGNYRAARRAVLAASALRLRDLNDARAFRGPFVRIASYAAQIGLTIDAGVLP